MRDLVLPDTPSNLGLRPPSRDIEPGCAKLARALRGCDLLERLNALDDGIVAPPRYAPVWTKSGGPPNAQALAAYSRLLADRIAPLFDESVLPVVLGGDCSILLAPMLALKRRGRHCIAYFDAQTDFWRLGKSQSLEAVGGEDVAIMTGRGDARFADMELRGPSVSIADVAYIGVRDDASYLEETLALGARAFTASQIERNGANGIAKRLLDGFSDVPGFWIHLDLDVVDGGILPAVDSLEPAGLDYATVSALLEAVSRSPKALAVTVAIFDPDLDPDGRNARAVSDCIVTAFSEEM